VPALARCPARSQALRIVDAPSDHFVLQARDNKGANQPAKFLRRLTSSPEINLIRIELDFSWTLPIVS
jgi:hypothetical protein